MHTDTLAFQSSTARITVIENIIYVRVSGVYDDEVALALMKFLDPLIEQIGDAPIRVWDASEIPSAEFKLSTPCIEKVSAWANSIKNRKPESKAYMIAPSAISFGMARMYGAMSKLDQTNVIILRGLDELPPSIRSKIPDHLR